MIPDPPVRADGRCYVCPKQRHPERSRKLHGSEGERDSFCSVECARAYHGLPDLAAEGRARQGKPKVAVGGGRHGNNFQHGTRKGYRLCACELCTAAVKRDRNA